MAPGECDQFAGDPGIVVGIQHQLGQRIAAVRVEAGGDDQQFGREGIEGGQQVIALGAAEGFAAASGRERSIGDIVRRAALVPIA